jgi:hypothetical protein
MAITMPDPQLLTKSGFLLYSPLGSTEPTNTVVGNVFTDAWPVAWVPLGRTTGGAKVDDNATSAAIESAEDYSPLLNLNTKREPGVSFELMSFTATNLSRALNGAVTTVTGTTTTTLTKVSAPDPMSEVQCMIGWESDDATVRFVGRQCLNTGNLSVTLAKAPSTATIPWAAVLSKPAGLPAYDWFFAGTNRA